MNACDCHEPMVVQKKRHYYLIFYIYLALDYTVGY